MKARDLITVKDAAALLGITTEALYFWRKNYPSRIPCIEYGEGDRQTIRYDRAEVLRYIERCKTSDGVA